MAEATASNAQTIINFPDKEGIELYFSTHKIDVSESLIKLSADYLCNKKLEVKTLKVLLVGIIIDSKMVTSRKESSKLLNGLMRCVYWHNFHVKEAEKEMDRLQVKYRLSLLSGKSS